MSGNLCFFVGEGKIVKIGVDIHNMQHIMNI
jgi:hypothetical protein